MPAHELPSDYGIDDAAMPEGLWAQIAYPLMQRDEERTEPQAGGLAQHSVFGSSSAAAQGCARAD